MVVIIIYFGERGWRRYFAHLEAEGGPAGAGSILRRPLRSGAAAPYPAGLLPQKSPERGKGGLGGTERLRAAPFRGWVAGKKPNGVPRPAVCMDSFLCLFFFFFTWVGCAAREGRQCCSVRGKQAGCLRYQHILTRRMNFQRSINNYLRVCLFVRCVDVVPEVSQ